MIRYSTPSRVIKASIVSRVVPAILLTMDLLDPYIRLNSDDLPTFGRPTNATFVQFSFRTDVILDILVSAMISSNKSDSPE